MVAASLVAAAAAIKNPSKARDMATAVGDELKAASKQAVNRDNAFWQLALDIAKRSIDALGVDSGAVSRDKCQGEARPARKAKAKTGAKTGAKAKTSGKAKTSARKRRGNERRLTKRR